MKSAHEIAEWSHRWRGAMDRVPQDQVKDWDTYSYNELLELATRTLELPENSIIVEIGTYIGRSASVFLQVAQEKSLDITLVDPFGWNPAWAKKSFQTLIGEHFKGVQFTLMEMESDIAAYHWRNQQLEVLPQNVKPSRQMDLLHIDGNHTFHGVNIDCKEWLPRLKRGGYALFHDYHDPRDSGVTVNVDYHCYGWEGKEVERLAVRRKPLL